MRPVIFLWPRYLQLHLSDDSSSTRDTLGIRALSVYVYVAVITIIIIISFESRVPNAVVRDRRSSIGRRGRRGKFLPLAADRFSNERAPPPFSFALEAAASHKDMRRSMLESS